MHSVKIIDWLNQQFILPRNALVDSSLVNRRELIPESIIYQLKDSFIGSMNGLATEVSEEIGTVWLATFLNDDVVNQICQSGGTDGLIVVHHFFDMDCGFPNERIGKPFHFITGQSFEALKKSRIAIYAAHLPFDSCECPFNTSLAFAMKIGANCRTVLNSSTLPRIGYDAVIGCNIDEHLSSLFGTVFHYGKPYQYHGGVQRVAVIAGVISKQSIIFELQEMGFEYLICGDVLVRIPGPRYDAMLYALEQSNMSIFCVSHLKSERCGLEYLAQRIKYEMELDAVVLVEEDDEWK